MEQLARAPLKASTSSSLRDVEESPEEAKARIAGVFGRAAPTYDTIIPFFDAFARHLVAAALLKTGARVLDVACGRGACVRAAAEIVGPGGYVLGLDLSAPMIAEAKVELAALKIRNVYVRIGDAEHLDLPDASFDTVLCGFGVFFFQDPAAAFSECRRVLRAGGRFAASTFVDGVGGYKWDVDVLKEIGQPDPRTKLPNPLRKAEGLLAALARHGFKDQATTRVEARFVLSSPMSTPTSPGNGRMADVVCWSPSAARSLRGFRQQLQRAWRTMQSLVVTSSSRPSS